MRNAKILFLLAIIVYACPVQFFLNEVAVGQSSGDNITYTVKVIDITGMPVVGAEVVILSVELDLADGRKEMEPVNKKTIPPKI